MYQTSGILQFQFAEPLFTLRCHGSFGTVMSNLTEQMAANALEAQKLTRKFFVVELNFSEASIQEMEGLFDTVAYSLTGGNSAENFQMLTRAWGSYLGEVIRKKLGGEWVAITHAAGERTALRCSAGDLFPHEQVSNRLHGDASANIWEYLKRLELAS